jgi:hypothetical protein
MNIIPLFGGIVFSALGIYICYDYRRFNKNALKIKGRVLRYEEYISKGTDNIKRKMYRPFFELTVNGTTYDVKSKTSFRSKIIPVGHHADVLYQEGDEENARLAKGNGEGLGLLFIALSLPAYYFGLFH